MAFKSYDNNNTERNYEVKEKFGVLNPGSKKQKELRLVAWNGNAPRYDLRPWTQNPDGTESAGRGIALSAAELTNLYEILKEMDSDETENTEESEE